MTTDLGTVAVLGTGLMGAPMAGNLAAAGADVRVWNRTASRSRATAERYRLTDTATPAQAARDVDVLVTMLYDADAVDAALTGPDGALATLRPGTLWLQTSTVGVAGEARLRALADQHGLAYVDAPVLGSRLPAENGHLVVLASGSDADRRRAEQLFAPLAARVEWVGAAGAGSRFKMVVNAWVLALTAAMSEAVSMAEGLDVDPQVFLRLLDGHPTDAPYARAKATSMLRRSFEPSAHLAGGHKDTRLVLEAAEVAGIRPLVMRAVEAQFAAAVDAGHGAEDLAAVYWAARTTHHDGTE